MPQFHETGYGQRFFEGQLPTLIRALEAIAKNLEPQRPENGNWMQLDGVPGYLHLSGGITLWGCSFHVGAIEVYTHGTMQEVAHPENGEDYDHLCSLSGGDGQLDTIEIEGKQHVVFLTPYER